MKDKYATLVTQDADIRDRWMGHFDDILNVEYEREYV